MKATISENGKVTAYYCITHYNNTTKLVYIKIPDKVRVMIYKKLEEGVTMEKILDDIRDTVGNSIERKHLVNRQDLHNVKQQYNIENSTRHSNDQTSVDKWVNEMASYPYNPIILYKRQGK